MWNVECGMTSERDISQPTTQTLLLPLSKSLTPSLTTPHFSFLIPR